jgi:hypothetical protein
VPDTNRARHQRSSARRGCPASEHCLFTRVAYAPPSRSLALRHCLHGSPRFILAVLARAFALPKALRRCVPTAKRPPLPPAQHLLQPTALSLRFSTSACAECRWRSTPALSSGGRLSFTVGLAAFSSTYSSSPPERSPLRAALRSHRARHQPRTPSALIGPP